MHQFNVTTLVSAKCLLKIRPSRLTLLNIKSREHIKGWGHDSQHNDIPHNDTKHNGLIYDIQHNDTQHTH
jgi:hypothetical protein